MSGNDRQWARLARPCGPGRNPGEVRVDDAGRVNPHEPLAFPGTWLRRLLVGERLGAIAGAQTNRLHAPLPNNHLSAELELYGNLSSISCPLKRRPAKKAARWQAACRS